MRLVFYFTFVSWIVFESCGALNPAVAVIGKISQTLILKIFSEYISHEIFDGKKFDAEFTIEKLNDLSKQMRSMEEKILNLLEKKEFKSKYERSKIELYKYIDTVNIYYNETFHSILNASMNLDHETIKESCESVRKKDGRLQLTLLDLGIHAKNYLKAFKEDLEVIFFNYVSQAL